MLGPTLYIEPSSQKAVKTDTMTLCYTFAQCDNWLPNVLLSTNKIYKIVKTKNLVIELTKLFYCRKKSYNSKHINFHLNICQVWEKYTFCYTV